MVRHRHSRRGWPLAAGLIFLTAWALPAPAAAQSTAERVAAAVRKCANRERAKAGLGPLGDNPVLDKIAQRHARNMAREGFFDHTDPKRGGLEQRANAVVHGDALAMFNGLGENIAEGEDSPAQACTDWMNSPEHRENILDASFHAVGGGFAQGDSTFRFYYVQEFAERNVGGAPASDDKARPTGTQPEVAMRLWDAEDRLTLSVGGDLVATVRPGQARSVKLGRLEPDARITVEAFSASGRVSWGIEERRGTRTVYRDSHAIGEPPPPPTERTIDLAAGATPLVRRVTLDTRGHVLLSTTPRAPRRRLWGSGVIAAAR